MKYNTPEIEIIELNMIDVITTSGEGETVEPPKTGEDELPIL